MKNHFIDTGEYQRPHVAHESESSQVYSWDFGREATRRGTTVISAEWKSTNLNISSEDLTGSVATATVFGNGECAAKLECKCTFADSTVANKVITVQVIE